MPLIPDAILDCAVYLYGSAEDAKQGQPFGGSGFLLSVPMGYDEPLNPDSAEQNEKANFAANDPAGELYGRSHLYLVTNRHVVKYNRFVRINTTTGSSRIINLSGAAWIGHQAKSDDVSVCPITQPEGTRFFAIPLPLLVTKEWSGELSVGPGDDVFMIGRYSGHEGRMRNLPTVRFGHISMMPHEPIETDSGPAEAYLVEVHSIPGYSGSPVLLNLASPLGLREMEPSKFPLRSGMAIGAPYWLLGINFVYFTGSAEKRQLDGSVLTLPLNTGMAGVVPAWKILEVLNYQKLRRQRARDRKRRVYAAIPS
jgi:hypothetical protein